MYVFQDEDRITKCSDITPLTLNLNNESNRDEVATSNITGTIKVKDSRGNNLHTRLFDFSIEENSGKFRRGCFNSDGTPNYSQCDFRKKTYFRVPCFTGGTELEIYDQFSNLVCRKSLGVLCN